ncbi:hypothetical protein SRRS_18900 [Sporomusa rhizae]|uniref:hypothetical protein n=1 Tax=Sporomusa rhizae TaxID=357999 RepID=UPI00352BB212
MKQHRESKGVYQDYAYPDLLDIPAGKAVALEELDENERLSIAMSSYYLLYR